MSDHPSFEQLLGETVKAAVREVVDELQAAALDRQRLLSVSKVAELLDLSGQEVRNLANRKYDPLPSLRIGKEYRFRLVELEAWEERQRDEKQSRSIRAV